RPVPGAEHQRVRRTVPPPGPGPDVAGRGDAQHPDAPDDDGCGGRHVGREAEPRHGMSAGEGDRPAFYALSPGGWRDYWSLLHPPYTAWHLSYVVIGAALAPHVQVRWLLETLLAFFLAMGVAAHALDELNGRPLRTRIPDGVLWRAAGRGRARAV